MPFGGESGWDWYIVTLPENVARSSSVPFGGESGWDEFGNKLDGYINVVFSAFRR